MTIIVYQATNDQGKNHQRIVVENFRELGPEGARLTEARRNKRLAAVKRELLAMSGGKIISTSWVNVNSLLDGWGYTVTVEAKS